MRNVQVMLGKDFQTGKWGVSLSNKARSLSFFCEDGFKETMPYPGSLLDENDIAMMIEFLQETLKELEDDN